MYSPGSTLEKIACVGNRLHDWRDRIVASMRSPVQKESAARLTNSIVALRSLKKIHIQSMIIFVSQNTTRDYLLLSSFWLTQKIVFLSKKRPETVVLKE